MVTVKIVINSTRIIGIAVKKLRKVQKSVAKFVPHTRIQRFEENSTAVV